MKYLLALLKAIDSYLLLRNIPQFSYWVYRRSAWEQGMSAKGYQEWKDSQL